METHAHKQPTKIAIGYVRVSAQEQSSNGVSLDAQRDRLTAYCKLNGINIIDIKADEGISGSTLERPGLQAALQMLQRGRANTLLVAKLDRLSRSLRDVCALVEDFFGDDRYHLLSLCGMVTTHSAAGRMVLMNLASYNHFEREVISERTRDALRHMMSQGVLLGPAPCGYEFSHDADGLVFARAAANIFCDQALSSIPCILRLHPATASCNCILQLHPAVARLPPHGGEPDSCKRNLSVISGDCRFPSWRVDAGTARAIGHDMRS